MIEATPAQSEGHSQGQGDSRSEGQGPGGPGRGSGRKRSGPLSGRQAEAARNDQRILASARAVFVNDPGAPITAVAKHAGVGISALYTRYGSKEELLRKLCTDGLMIVVAETEAAIEQVQDGRDHWQVFARFMRNLADADTSSMTQAFAGKFAPTPEMHALASHSSKLMDELFGMIRDVLRPDLALHDVSLVFELVAAIKFSRPERTRELRHRYLALILDGMRATDRAPLPGPPPAWPEISERWNAK
jgi:AcrR family transcriptional regulator